MDTNLLLDDELVDEGEIFEARGAIHWNQVLRNLPKKLMRGYKQSGLRYL